MMPLAAIDWHGFFFMLFALLACGFGIAVVASSNIVRMAFYLTLSLGATAGLFFLAGAEFVGAMQFMIYVGGTLVLLIFGVMLTAQSDFISMKTAAGEWISAGVLGAALLVLLMRAGFSVEEWRTPRADRYRLTVEETENTAGLAMGLVGVRTEKLEGTQPLPNSFSGYLLPFVIVSMHLLVVLVGAGYLARTKRHGSVTAASRRAAQPIAELPTRKHSFFVSVGIWKGIVINAILAVLAITFPQIVENYGNEEGAPVQQWLYTVGQTTPTWLPLMLAGLFGLNVLLLYVAWNWQRWAVVALLIIPLVIFGVVAASPWGITPAVVLGLLTFLPAAVLFGLLMTGRNRAWARME